MNGGILQLWVERLALDPAAWTAGHALQLLMGQDAPARVGRADLWEIEDLGPSPADATGDADRHARFETWMRSSNLFMNPSRDRGKLLAGSPPEMGAAIGHVVCVDRGAGESRAHALTLGHALGGRWKVRRGTVWTLAWPGERAESVPALLETAAFARRRHTGLLVQPESQEARLFVDAWDCPALPAGDSIGAQAPAGGSDGGVA